MNQDERVSGILLPLSSLPGSYGIGSLGQNAYRFVDFLARSHVRIWQMLPLNVTSYGDSPYQSPSSNGLNYYFIDLDILCQEGLLKKEEIDNVDFGTNPGRVDYGKLFQNRIPVLKKAFKRFNKQNPDFLSFVKKGEYKDFAFFMTLKVKNDYRPWYEWPDELKNYTPALEEKVIQEDRDEYLFYMFTQFEFLKQYNALKKYANLQKIKILGDMPLYLAYDSVEAYKYPEMFRFDSNHNPTVVAGCPPDCFSADGQLWGNPIYNWSYMAKDGYKWFKDRIKKNLQNFDILRIDHFRGCSSYYTIPFGMTNARIGQWEKGPGFDLFRDLTNLPLIAEDLGFMDDGVRQLLKDSTYPGMKVLEFSFDGDPTNSHKPSNSSLNYFCYTGTHDNMPICAYIKSLSQDGFERYVGDLKKECERFGVDFRGDSMEELTRTTDKLCLAGPTIGAVIPLQDYLALGEESRINEPSTLTEKNWTWRCQEKDFSQSLMDFIRENVTRYNR
ncbi:MAG: 4-alpha-glucanotransferase [Bacilli bacterium]